MPKITYLPANKTLDVTEAQCLRDAGLNNGVDIPSTCGGVGSCGLCKVKIVSGAEHLTPMTALELGKLGNVFFITKERLSCQTHAKGDVTLEVPDEAAERAARASKAKETYRDRLMDRSRQKPRR